MSTTVSEQRTTLIKHPDFASICSFFQTVGPLIGFGGINCQSLLEILDNSQAGNENEMGQKLFEIIFYLLRKYSKWTGVEFVASEWCSLLLSVCSKLLKGTALKELRSHDGDVRLCSALTRAKIIKSLLDMQFDCNDKLKRNIEQFFDASEFLRVQPVGCDMFNRLYWMLVDDRCNVFVYREDSADVDGRSWRLLAESTSDLNDLIDYLMGCSEQDCEFGRQVKEEPVQDGEEEEQEQEEQEEQELEEQEEKEQEKEKEDKKVVSSLNDEGRKEGDVEKPVEATKESTEPSDTKPREENKEAVKEKDTSSTGLPESNPPKPEPTEGAERKTENGPSRTNAKSKTRKRRSFDAPALPSRQSARLVALRICQVETEKVSSTTPKPATVRPAKPAGKPKLKKFKPGDVPILLNYSTKDQNGLAAASEEIRRPELKPLDIQMWGRNAQRQYRREKGEPFEEELGADRACSECNSEQDPETMLLCDNCDSAHHMSCMKRCSLVEMPQFEWVCFSCRHQRLVSELRERLNQLDQNKKKLELQAKRSARRLLVRDLNLDNIFSSDSDQEPQLDLPTSTPTPKTNEETPTEQEDRKKPTSPVAVAADKECRQMEKELFSRRGVRSQKVTYTFDDYDDAINEALMDDEKFKSEKQTKQSQDPTADQLKQETDDGELATESDEKPPEKAAQDNGDDGGGDKGVEPKKETGDSDGNSTGSPDSDVPSDNQKDSDYEMPSDVENKPSPTKDVREESDQETEVHFARQRAAPIIDDLSDDDFASGGRTHLKRAAAEQAKKRYAEANEQESDLEEANTCDQHSSEDELLSDLKVVCGDSFSPSSRVRTILSPNARRPSGGGTSENRPAGFANVAAKKVISSSSDEDIAHLPLTRAARARKQHQRRRDNSDGSFESEDDNFSSNGSVEAAPASTRTRLRRGVVSESESDAGTRPASGSAKSVDSDPDFVLPTSQRARRAAVAARRAVASDNDSEESDAEWRPGGGSSRKRKTPASRRNVAPSRSRRAQQRRPPAKRPKQSRRRSNSSSSDQSLSDSSDAGTGRPGLRRAAKRPVAHRFSSSEAEFTSDSADSAVESRRRQRKPVARSTAAPKRKTKPDALLLDEARRAGATFDDDDDGDDDDNDRLTRSRPRRAAAQKVTHYQNELPLHLLEGRDDDDTPNRPSRSRKAATVAPAVATVPVPTSDGQRLLPETTTASNQQPTAVTTNQQEPFVQSTCPPATSHMAKTGTPATSSDVSAFSVVPSGMASTTAPMGYPGDRLPLPNGHLSQLQRPGDGMADRFLMGSMSHSPMPAGYPPYAMGPPSYRLPVSNGMNSIGPHPGQFLQATAPSHRPDLLSYRSAPTGLPPPAASWMGPAPAPPTAAFVHRPPDQFSHSQPASTSTNSPLTGLPSSSSSSSSSPATGAPAKQSNTDGPGLISSAYSSLLSS